MLDEDDAKAETNVSRESISKKVHFKNTVVAFINDGIDFWKFKCRTEPLHVKKRTRKYHESYSESAKSVKGKRKKGSKKKKR